MGLSSNQARFLSLTARQVDLEQRIQQICQRRLRLSSELENVATQYNNKISNRKMFTANQTNQGINTLSLSNLKKLGYKVIDSDSKKLVDNVGLMNKSSAPIAGSKQINSEQDFLNIIATMNGGDSAATAALADKYVLNCDIDLSDNPAFTKSIIDGTFSGTFDGQGHTISGATMNISSSQQYVGFFSQLSGANVKNLVLDDFTINGSGSSSITNLVGVLAGYGSGTVDNVATTNSKITVGQNYQAVGGFMGADITGLTVTNSYSTTDIVGADGCKYIGGFFGDINHATISKCYSSGSVTVGNGCTNISGFGGSTDLDANVNNCYSTVDMVAGNNCTNIGGFMSNTAASSNVTVNNCYAAGSMTVGTGTTAGGFIAQDANGLVNNTNFYKISNNPSMTSAGSAVNASTNPIPLGTWNTGTWDLSGDLPTLIGTNDSSLDIEEGLRNGTLSLAREADEFTQTPLSIAGGTYEEIDWRTTPEIYDELYRGDDVAAEDKYDKIISEINAQDKKLQLEQTSIEVQYKAITSERESVKKILDTNAQASFKYFS